MITNPETPEQKAARRGFEILEIVKSSNIAMLEQGLRETWGSGADPQGVCDAWGSAAAVYFASNAAFVTFLITQLTALGDTDGLARVQAALALVPAHTLNEDGTVTITSPEPDPE